MKNLWAWLRDWWFFATHTTLTKKLLVESAIALQESGKVHALAERAIRGDQEVLEQLDQCLRAIGQMRHVDGHPGIMSMNVTERAILSAKAGEVFSKAFRNKNR